MRAADITRREFLTTSRSCTSSRSDGKSRPVCRPCEMSESSEPVAFVLHACAGAPRADVVRLVNDNQRVLATDLLRGLELDAAARNRGDARAVAERREEQVEPREVARPLLRPEAALLLPPLDPSRHESDQGRFFAAKRSVVDRLVSSSSSMKWRAMKVLPAPAGALMCTLRSLSRHPAASPTGAASLSRHRMHDSYISANCEASA